MVEATGECIELMKCEKNRGRAVTTVNTSDFGRCKVNSPQDEDVKR